jgi:hypothetical protein
MLLKKPIDMERALEGEDSGSTRGKTLDAALYLVETQNNKLKYLDKTRVLFGLRQLYDHIYTRS